MIRRKVRDRDNLKSPFWRRINDDSRIDFGQARRMNFMNIYISHSRNFDFQHDLYEPLKVSELAEHHTFIFPHETEEAFNSKELFNNKGCDLVIAEVSYPATGVGIELGWADLLNIPIVCIYKEGVEPSQSLHAVSKRFMMYTSSENMIEDISGLLRKYE